MGWADTYEFDIRPEEVLEAVDPAELVELIEFLLKNHFSQLLVFVPLVSDEASLVCRVLGECGVAKGGAGVQEIGSGCVEGGGVEEFNDAFLVEGEVFGGGRGGGFGAGVDFADEFLPIGFGL